MKGFNYDLTKNAKEPFKDFYLRNNNHEGYDFETESTDYDNCKNCQNKQPCAWEKFNDGEDIQLLKIWLDENRDFIFDIDFNHTVMDWYQEANGNNSTSWNTSVEMVGIEIKQSLSDYTGELEIAVKVYLTFDDYLMVKFKGSWGSCSSCGANYGIQELEDMLKNASFIWYEKDVLQEKTK